MLHTLRIRIEWILFQQQTYQPIKFILRYWKVATNRHLVQISHIFSVVDIFLIVIAKSIHCSLNQCVFTAWCLLAGVNWGGSFWAKTSTPTFYLWMHTCIFDFSDCIKPIVATTSSTMEMMEMSSRQQFARAITSDCIVLVDVFDWIWDFLNIGHPET